MTVGPDHASVADHERVIEALPALRGRPFATGRWGRGWQTALEDTALEVSGLTAGRRLARAGAVGAVMVRAGRATAVVRDRGGTGHRADILVRPLDDEEWDRLLTGAAAEAGHLAALLDGELPERWVEDAETAGVELLPGIGELEPSCSCDAWDHCAHTAALGYQFGRLLDREPLLLLLLRGRATDRVVEELRNQPSAGGTASDAVAPGVPASAAWARTVPPLPAAPPVPDVPGAEAPDLTGTPPPVDGLGEALGFLLGDSAARAAATLVGALASDHATSAPEPVLSRWQDAARMAAGDALPEPVATRLARACGRSRGDLAAAGAAWRCGRAAGLAVLEADGDDPALAAADVPAGHPPAGVATDGVPDAEAVLAAAWDGPDRPRLRRSGHRWTVVGEGVQLRRGGDGRWWPYRRERGRWWPVGPGASGPAAALAAARAGGPDGDSTERGAG